MKFPAGERPERKSAPFDCCAAWALFALLTAFTITIGDYSLISLHVIAALLLALAALYLILGLRQTFHWSVAFVCPLLMSMYGVGQTLWSDQKIVANGWEKTLYWFTAAIIAMLATQVFRIARLAQQFRMALALLGGGIALLDLLQQASHTGKYFWLFPSGFPDVYATFAYYNNFSQFIELTLPISLWLGLSHREPQYNWLLLSALQIGAVVACGSRAGAAIVIAELFALLLLAFLRRRGVLSLKVIGLTLLLSLGFIYVAGFQTVVQKLERPDQLATRREINEASLAMIKARPLTGWGLGSYVPVYKMFALYDDGTWVNQAHNDYLEWAAEGGIPFACIMVVLILWSVRPAVRSVWGIGLLAFCLHALVDYPFARMGTCGWYFALAGMLAWREMEPARAKRYHRRRSHSEDSESTAVTAGLPQTHIL
jgi:O-antigen ligase